MRARWFLLSLGFILLMTACQAGEARPTPTSGVFRPPTQVTPSAFVAPTAAADELSGELRPTPTPSCTDYLRFLADVTIPDGTVVSPGDELDKRWQVMNIGTCNWDDSYQVRLIAGPDMDVPETQSLYPARSGTEFTIRMNFTAPDESGTYRSAWQAYSPQGEAFGDPFYIEVIVVDFIAP
jgi:hypothetical protein